MMRPSAFLFIYLCACVCDDDDDDDGSGGVSVRLLPRQLKSDISHYCFLLFFFFFFCSLFSHTNTNTHEKFNPIGEVVGSHREEEEEQPVASQQAYRNVRCHAAGTTTGRHKRKTKKEGVGEENKLSETCRRIQRNRQNWTSRTDRSPPHRTAHRAHRPPWRAVQGRRPSYRGKDRGGSEGQQKCQAERVGEVDVSGSVCVWWVGRRRCSGDRRKKERRKK
ncbi:hypothetical protein TCSYLVIO_001110 [Trypanosoma cruzi]|nr:hypothetical protein TCSYLVIO_001110 [Trypanosoma cruzi]